MNTCTQLIDDARLKRHFRSDREIGELFGCSAPAIAAARRGKMSDPIAVKLAELLKLDPGYVLWIARTEREKDPAVRMHLEAWGKRLGKILGSVPQKAVGAVCALAVALGLMFLPARDAQAFGGAGRCRFRP